jgi:rubrerythrin
MLHFESIDEILDFAVKQEEMAATFYKDLAKRTKSEEMKNVFLNFAKEETGHKAKLLLIKEKGTYTVAPAKKILDLKISDTTDNIPVSPNMEYREVLTVAMHREKLSFMLYSKLADYTDNEELKNIFLMLAQEEAKHKLRFEVEYDENVLKEN